MPTNCSEDAAGNLNLTDVSTTVKPSSAMLEQGTRVGSVAYLFFSIVALLTNITLPFLLKIDPSERWVYERSPTAFARNYRTAAAIFSTPWFYAHVLFAVCMLSTFLVDSWMGASVLVSYTGISWAMAQWVPFTIIGEAVSTHSRRENAQGHHGAIMGLHNIAISAPQVLAAVTSSVILWIAREMKSEDSAGWVLRAGACATLGAAYLTRSLNA